ncbi:MAG: hypothetical protein LBP55_09585 [Candidatus Adiutrix sp.]|nr:hypothetical protein [Candidatus Adiutrix sp.]
MAESTELTGKEKADRDLAPETQATAPAPTDISSSVPPRLGLANIKEAIPGHFYTIDYAFAVKRLKELKGFKHDQYLSDFLQLKPSTISEIMSLTKLDPIHSSTAQRSHKRKL